MNEGNNETKKTKIAANFGGKIFFFVGQILKEENGFLTILDDKEGVIDINLACVLSRKVVGC